MDRRYERARTVTRVILAAAMIAVGVTHFISPEGFVRIVPKALPAPLALVYVSGFFEALGGVGILIPRVRSAAGWGLVALYACVFPANINMAVNVIQIGDAHLPVWALWLRLPFQVLFMVCAWWCTRPRAPTPDSKASVQSSGAARAA